MSTGPISSGGETLLLRDGRTLGYITFGSSKGKTVFYFHGVPGSRLEARFLANQAEVQGVRIIGIDRPGMGFSSYQPGRRFLDWPDDVVELADHLDIDRFSVVGLSGGGPYALSCAYKIPDRLNACGIIAGVGHLGFLRSFLSRWLPWILMPLTKHLFRDKIHAEKWLTRFAGTWPEPDKESLLKLGAKEILANSIIEALRPGIKGAAYDATLLGLSWGFNLENIDFPVALWHGELDKEVSVESARAVAAKIPHCRVVYYSNEGHISPIVNHQDEIMKALIDDGLSES
jgi:pimeloyl-ACP methyl ester carboxylesterase